IFTGHPVINELLGVLTRTKQPKGTISIVVGPTISNFTPSTINAVLEIAEPPELSELLELLEQLSTYSIIVTDKAWLPKYLINATLVTKDDVALDNDLTLPSEIKVTVNRDSFWELLVILHNLLHPFCEALDLMQYDKAYFHNVLHSFGFIIQIFKELKAEKVIAIKTDDDNNEDEDSSSEANWDVIIDGWEELLIEEEFEEEQDGFDEVDINFLSLEIHPAKNQTAKWELQNLFLPNLPFPFENI
ncbi:45716_t:CDS:2, partial [Gigaspora margarita]